MAVSNPKRTRARGRLGLILATLAATGLLAVGASADDITNDLSGTAGVLTLTSGGDTGSTDLTVVPHNGDGKNGCNLTGSSTLVVSVHSSDPSVATASPASLTFGSCGDVKTVTVTSGVTGSATVTLTQVSNTTGASFNLAPAAFTVHVVPPPNTPPAVTVTSVEHGAGYAKGSVPAAGCAVEDAEDGSSSFAADLSAITGAYAADGLGNQTATCSYTDAGGLTQETSATYSIYDPSAPTIDWTLSPSSPDGDDGWYRGDVTLVWDVGEPESPSSLALEGCDDQTVVTDGEFVFSCWATSAGGSLETVDVAVRRDATKPTISGSRTPDANVFGWNTGDVVVSFVCADAVSGLASCTADQTLGGEGRDQSVVGTARDRAGNTDSATVGGINVDRTAPAAPSVTPDRAPDYAGAGGWYRDEVVVTFAGAGDPDLANGDAGSGVDPATVSAPAVFDSSGSHTASGTVSDRAGNESATGSLTVQVDADAPSVAVTCPSTPVVLGSVVSAGWTAADAESGLATPASGSVALDTSSVGTKSASAPTAADNVGHSAGAACFYNVVFDFRGFFRPVDSPPMLNVVKAGSGIPVKFSLSGDQGLDIFAVGYPVSYGVDCDNSAPLDTVEQTVTAGGSSLSYDAGVDQYVYVWKSDKAWAGSCRLLDVTLVDGARHIARFKFAK
jgi:hypothetical protein